tara:strand:- start:29201 stop:30250 length:1050 start_codon:yes stop_codon:yes gene_type:complete
MNILNNKFRYLLFPLALFYWGLVFWRNTFYGVGFFVTRRLPCKVISVGNLTVGGTGKTPFVIYLANKLQSLGKKVCIISRGYGRESHGTVIISDGNKILTNWKDAGDEPYLMASILKNVPIIVDENRFRGGLLAIQKFNPDIILLDDGFQHRALERDLDIVLLNSLDPSPAYKLLPYGKLREPLDVLKRTDLIIWTKSNLQPPPTLLKRKILNMKIINLRGVLGSSSKLISHDDNKIMELNDFKNKRVFAFCGIGDPNSFIKLMKKSGLNLVSFKSFDDHHNYSNEELNTLFEAANQSGSKAMITTYKDFVKIPLNTISFPIYALPIDFHLPKNDEEELIKIFKLNRVL